MNQIPIWCSTHLNVTEKKKIAEAIKNNFCIVPLLKNAVCAIFSDEDEFNKISLQTTSEILCICVTSRPTRPSILFQKRTRGVDQKILTFCPQESLKYYLGTIALIINRSTQLASLAL